MVWKMLVKIYIVCIFSFVKCLGEVVFSISLLFSSVGCSLMKHGGVNLRHHYPREDISVESRQPPLDQLLPQPWPEGTE